MNTTERRQLYKSNIVKVMGGKCVCCGYNKCDRALELHHINPDTKTFGISEKAYYAWDSLKSELQKCVLVCANCHAEIESNQLSSPTCSSFNEEMFNIIAQDIEQKKQGKLCIDCGKKIDYKAIRCPECDAKHRRVCERPTREELKLLIRTFPFTTIAKNYQVSDNTIRKWCISYGLPSKVSIIKQYSDQDWSIL